MGKGKEKRLEKAFELDDIVTDGAYCVAPTEEDIRAFQAYMKKHREEQKKNKK